MTSARALRTTTRPCYLPVSTTWCWNWLTRARTSRATKEACQFEHRDLHWGNVSPRSCSVVARTASARAA
ncbi:unnamed protein product [Leptidea sinapis]|uniref:Uncharacterized protein n=1 Tax=Leptidea sinapis TaxID=189913 RepID=A0A5E4PPR2_9NEOP|nr:unnamed protein product [Leptidea sinapis]